MTIRIDKEATFYSLTSFLSLSNKAPALEERVEKNSEHIVTIVHIWINPEGNVIKSEIKKSSGYPFDIIISRLYYLYR